MREIEDVIVLLFLVACSVCDWRKKEIPVKLLIAMSAVSAILTILHIEEMPRSRFLGAGLGLLFFIISKCTKQAVGYGDSWLILLLGIYLGVMKTIQLLFAASLVAGIVSLFYLWKCHWKKNATIPFVPFLAAAYLGVMFI